MKNKDKHNPFSLVDPFFDDFFFEDHPMDHFPEPRHEGMPHHGPMGPHEHMMKTDIREEEKSYELSVELPEVKKEDIHLSLEDGYLTIEAVLHENHGENRKSHYIRKERFFGRFERTFFVGENVTEKDIQAKLADGVLYLSIAKVEEPVKTKKYIEIQ